MEILIIIVAIVVVGLFIYLVRYIINNLVNKGADAIHNARVKKKNEEESSEPTNLADKYK